MKLTALLSCCALATALSLTPSHAQSSSDYQFSPPEVPREVGGQVFQYFLPAAEGFAANINMQIQPFEGGLQAYAEISEQQFEELAFEVIDVAHGESELVYQYRGNMQGVVYRWYSRVVQDGNYYYVVTATALDERWETERDQLVDAVHSFELNR